MHPDLEKLIGIQKLDSEILRKKALLVKLPQEIADHAASFNTASAELKAFDDSVAAEQKKRRDLEIEVETLKGKIAQDKAKLPNIKTNVEYRALVKELDGYEVKIKALEDQEILLMEAAEDFATNRLAYAEKAKAEEAEFNVIKVEKEAAIKVVKEKIAALEAQRAGLVGDIDAAIFRNYEKIMGAREGIGASAVIDMMCQTCHQKIPPQLYYNIKTDDNLHTCPHCSRYLYFPPELVKDNDENSVQ